MLPLKYCQLSSAAEFAHKWMDHSSSKMHFHKMALRAATTASAHASRHSHASKA
jgi:hypothetical protein